MVISTLNLPYTNTQEEPETPFKEPQLPLKDPQDLGGDISFGAYHMIYRSGSRTLYRTLTPNLGYKALFWAPISLGHLEVKALRAPRPGLLSDRMPRQKGTSEATSAQPRNLVYHNPKMLGVGSIYL